MELGTPPPRKAVAIASMPIEPSLPEGGCTVGGHALSIATIAIELCGAPGAACFGQLPAQLASVSTFVVESLRVTDSLAAHMIASAKGISVSAIVDARKLAPHPKRVEIVDRWFVPSWASMSFVRVRDRAAELSIAPSSNVTPVAPLTVDWTCDRLTSDPPNFATTDIEDAAALGHQPEAFVAPASGTLDLRATPSGVAVAKLQCEGQPVWVYARSNGRARAMIPTAEGWAVGWLDESKLTLPLGGIHRAPLPSMRTEYGTFGVRCDHDVNVLVKVGDATVQAATIHAGTLFDPADAADAFRRLGVVLSPNVRAWFAPHAVDDCAAE